eukprot:2447324-Pyramimonas_sp.AAC.1
MTVCFLREETTWTSAAAQAAGPSGSSIVGSRRAGATPCKTSGRGGASEPACSRCVSACVLDILLALLSLRVRNTSCSSGGAAWPRCFLDYGFMRRCSACRFSQFFASRRGEASESACLRCFSARALVIIVALLCLRARCASCSCSGAVWPRCFSDCGFLRCFSACGVSQFFASRAQSSLTRASSTGL